MKNHSMKWGNENRFHVPANERTNHQVFFFLAIAAHHRSKAPQKYDENINCQVKNPISWNIKKKKVYKIAEIVEFVSTRIVIQYLPVKWALGICMSLIIHIYLDLVFLCCTTYALYDIKKKRERKFFFIQFNLFHSKDWKEKRTVTISFIILGKKPKENKMEMKIA